MPTTSRLTRFTLALALATAAIASADEISINPSRDVTFNLDFFGDSGNGAGNYLFTGANAFGDPKRTILHFDIASALPAGAAIENVTLTMFCSRSASGSLQNTNLHTATDDWGEGDSMPGGNEGSGGPASPGDANWIYRFYEPGFTGPQWATPGGDYNPTSSAATGVIGAGQFYSWSSAQMIIDAQAWLDTPAGNFGWFVIGNESSTRTAKRFDSRSNPVESQRPDLTITFSAGNPCPADVAEPFGVLDLADVQAFIAAFVAGDLLADLAPPEGVLDLADVQAFIASFNAGCP